MEANRVDTYLSLIEGKAKKESCSPPRGKQLQIFLACCKIILLRYQSSEPQQLDLLQEQQRQPLLPQRERPQPL